MIPKFRIGKDVNIKWQILVNGQEQNLENSDLTIILRDPTGKMVEIPVFNVTNNIISFVLRGTSFHALGTYTLSCWMNKDNAGQTVVDSRDAFALVRYTDQEDCGDDQILTTDSSLNLSGNISYIISDTSGQIVGDYVTEDELTTTLNDYVKSEDVSNFVEIDDISNFVTNNDVSNFVTKSDISTK